MKTLILVQVLALQFLILIKASCLHNDAVIFPAVQIFFVTETALHCHITITSATLWHKLQIETSICVMCFYSGEEIAGRLLDTRLTYEWLNLSQHYFRAYYYKLVNKNSTYSLSCTRYCLYGRLDTVHQI